MIRFFWVVLVLAIVMVVSGCVSPDQHSLEVITTSDERVSNGIVIEAKELSGGIYAVRVEYLNDRGYQLVLASESLQPKDEVRIESFRVKGAGKIELYSIATKKQ
jgi:hypothetical protein